MMDTTLYEWQREVKQLREQNEQLRRELADTKQERDEFYIIIGDIQDQRDEATSRAERYESTLTELELEAARVATKQTIDLLLQGRYSAALTTLHSVVAPLLGVTWEEENDGDPAAV